MGKDHLVSKLPLYIHCTYIVHTCTARVAALIFPKPFVAVFYEFYKPLWLLVRLLCLYVNRFYAYCWHARHMNFHVHAHVHLNNQFFLS